MSPLVSIVIPSYNQGKYIEQTIVSILDQSYKNVEIIIIDGGSKDETVDIIKKQEDKITKWISEPDKGLYDAMNKGISMATGDIIGILNSDDTFFSNEILADIAKFHLNNSIDASVGNIIQHKEDGKIVRVYSSKYWNPQKLIIGFMPPHPSIFFKREFNIWVMLEYQLQFYLL